MSALAPPITGLDAAHALLFAVHGQKPDGHHVNVWALNAAREKRSHWFTSLGDAAEAGFELADDWNVYVGMATALEDRGPHRRCEYEHTAGIGALWMDLDVAGDGHKQRALPRTRADALALLDEAFPGLPPSIVVDTGGGLQVYYLLREFWPFETDRDRDEARDLLERWQDTIRAKAAAHGYTVESTADLPRVLRLPGTLNRKREPAPVVILEMDEGRRYNPSDFERFLLGPASVFDGAEVAELDGNPRPIGFEVRRFIEQGATADQVQREMILRTARACWGNLRTLEEACADAWRGIEQSGWDPADPWTEAEVHAIVRDVYRRKPSRPFAPAGTVLHKGKPLGQNGHANGVNGHHPAEQVDRRPSILATEPDLPKVTGDAWKAIIEANDPPSLFRHGGAIVRIETDDTAAPIVREVTPDRMRYTLGRVALWTKVEQDKKTGEMVARQTLPPIHVVKDVGATPDPQLPVLTRIVEAPVFGPSGELQTTPGYHPASQTFYAPPAGLRLEVVPERPTAADVAEARRLILDELLGDFAFADDADRAHAVALTLLPFARDLIRGPTPAHMIEASTPGSGKGLLADICLYPAVGRHVGVVTQARDDDEWRKRISSQLRAGRAAVLVDNINHPLTSATLAAVWTATVWEDRLLGTNDMLRVPHRTVWALTANNPVVSTEIARRIVRARLVPDVERPWEREPDDFRHPDLRGWAHDHRAELVWAALTLIRSWVAAGRPAWEGRPLGSFENWSKVIGGVLEHVGVPGFLANASEFYEEADTESAAWSGFVESWWEHFAIESMLDGVAQTRPATTKELYPIAAAVEGFDLGDSAEARSQMAALGKRLSYKRGAIIAGRRIVPERQSERSNKSRRWVLQLAKPGSPGDVERRRTLHPPAGRVQNGRSGDVGGCDSTQPTRVSDSPLDISAREGWTELPPPTSPAEMRAGAGARTTSPGAGATPIAPVFTSPAAAGDRVHRLRAGRRVDDLVLEVTGFEVDHAGEAHAALSDGSAWPAEELEPVLDDNVVTL